MANVFRLEKARRERRNVKSNDSAGARLRRWMGLTLMVVTFSARASAPGRVGMGGLALTPDPAAPIEIRADTLSYDADGKWAEAVGNVVVRSGSQVLRADRGRLNLQTGEIEASGNVMLEQGEGRDVWYGETLTYNFVTREGLAAETAFETEPFTIRTATTRTTPEGHMQVEGASITSCELPRGHEHYTLRARRATVRPGASITMRHVQLRLFGVPVLYSPWLYRGLRGDEGWRFEPGYSSRMGAFLLSTYRRRVLTTDDGGWVRSKSRIDYRTRRGVAGGQGFDWELPDLGDGDISFYLLDDRRATEDDRPPDRVDATRYRLSLQHAINTSPRDRWLLQADYLSDSYLLRDFYEDTYRRRRQPDNLVSYAHRAPSFSAGALMRFRLNDFYEQVERLPEVWLDVMRREAFAEGLYYESQNRLALLNRRFDDLSAEEDYDAWRLDSAHLLTYPFKTAGFLNLVPRAGARATFYSDTLQPRTEVELVTLTETNDLGQVTSRTTEVERRFSEPDGSDVRLRLELGLQAAFRAYRTFRVGERDWRHVVEPYADYTLIPEPTRLPAELYQFDRVDRLDEVHGVRLGTRNMLQTRSGRTIVNVADVDVHTTYRIARPSGADPVDHVHLDARFFPDDWIRLNARGTYSLSESALVSLDSRLHAWRSPVWSLDAEHNYRDDRRNAVTGSVTFSPNPFRRYNLYGRYDYHNGEIEEQGGYVQFSTDCLAMRLGGYVQPGYTRDDGRFRETDYRILLNVWLTAFPPDNLDRRYRQ